MSKTLAVRTDPIDGQVAEACLPQLVFESWQRSQTWGVVPDSKFVLLGRISLDYLKERLQANQELLEVVGRHLEWLHSWMSGTPHSLYFVDSDGIILFTNGNSPKIQQAFGLLPGYDRSERAIGTNGVGTALVIDQPTAVIGKEHYACRFHDYASFGIPIHGANNTVVGAIGLSTTVDEATARFLDLANYIAQVIDQELAYREEIRRAESFKFFSRARSITDPLLGEYELSNLLGQLLERIREIFDVDTAGILLKNPDGDELLMLTPDGMVRKTGRAIRVPGDRGFGGQSVAGQEPVIVDELGATEEFSPILRDNDIRSIMGAPLVADGWIHGVTFVGMTRPHRFSDDQARLLALVADRVAVRIAFTSRFEKERNARLEAEAASFAKSELLTVVSNKISSSHRLAQEWTSMLQRSTNGEAALSHMVEAIERGAKAQARIIVDGLDVLNIIDGTLRLEKQPVEITSLIKASVNSMKSAADEKSIQLQTVLESSYDLVSGDPDRLKQVFCRLLSNAIKSSRVGGRVLIRFKAVDSFARVTIDDTGKGISEEILPYLFNLFPPANGPIASKYDTLGLGLGTAQQLIEMHGGTVGVANLGKSEGASFIVNLPLIPLSSTLPQLNSVRTELVVKQGCALEDLPRLGGVRVFLKEEDPETSDLLTSALTQCGADTKSLDAAIALNALEQWHADLLISDLRMPGGVSHKLISKVSALKSGPGEKVSPMTLPARAVVKYWMRSLPAGSQIALKIPFDTMTLVMNAAKCVSKV